MLRIGKQNSSANIVLPAIVAIPNMDDLKFLLSKAQRNWRISAELPFRLVEGTRSFVIQVRCAVDNGQAWWTLYTTNEGDQSSMIWNHPSQDVYLIQNLILSECMQEQGSGKLPPVAYAADKEGGMAILPPGSDQDPNEASEAASRLLDTIDRAQAAHLTKEASFEGELKNMPVADVLKDIAKKKLTGKLEIWQADDIAEVFFADGAAEHATVGRAIGDGALIELLSWDQGVFHFFEGDKPIHQTIQKQIEVILTEGAVLLEQKKYLHQAGVTLKSYLLRKNTSMSEDAFAKALAGGAPVSQALQRTFYLAINDRFTLQQILDEHPMSGVQWIPIVCNLVKADLVQPCDALDGVMQPVLRPVEVDTDSVQSVIKALSNPDTGIYSYAALLYFLEQERLRFARGGMSYSLITFELCLEDLSVMSGLKPSSDAAAKEFCDRIKHAKRELDCLAHFEGTDFALLLPHTDREGAKVVANRMSHNLSTYPLSDGSRTHIYCGIASVPEDCQKTEELLTKAKEAKNQARESKQAVFCAGELKSVDGTY